MIRLAIILAALSAVAAVAQPDTATSEPRREAPPPADAILPGDERIAAIVCEADPAPIDASGALGLSREAAESLAASAAPRVVTVEKPWDAKPVMTGAGTPVAVTFFPRGRTLIFDAQSEVLYLDRDHRRFTYTRSAPGAVTTWHGICHGEG